MIQPFHERTVENGLTFGLGPAGYDVRIAQTVKIWPVDLETLIVNWIAKRLGWMAHRPTFLLASTIEEFDIPADIRFSVEDKSSMARRGLSLMNTNGEPGWRGYLTLELKNLGDDVITIPAGSPIVQICFSRLEEPTEMPYSGKYQDQEAGPQPARHELPTE